MTVKKIGVSLPEGLHKELAARAEAGEIPSISGHIVALLEAERVRADWIAAEEEVFGQLPSDESADAAWSERLRQSPDQIRAAAADHAA